MTVRQGRVAGGILLLAGITVLGWLGWATLRPPPDPYSYQLLEQGPASEFPDLGLSDWPDMPLKTWELRGARTGNAYALLHTSVDRDGDPVLLDWQNRVAEPVITDTAPLDDLIGLARAIEEHTPPDALLVAWWDTSRQLALLTGRDTLFQEHLVKPLLLPDAWRQRRSAIASLEREFWRLESDRADPAFDQFIDALLMKPEAAGNVLATLAGRSPAYLVLHQRDAYKLGALRPDQFGIGYRDFISDGQIHGLIKRAKTWLHEEGYRSYTIDAATRSPARVYFLTGAEAQETLAVEALSFTTSDPFNVTGLKLVYQNGGFWVYEIPSPGVTARGAATSDSG